MADSFPKVDEPLEAPYRHRGTRAVARMVEFAPSTGGLALWVKHQNISESQAFLASGPLVVTDGCTIFYSEGFAHLSLPEQVGHVAHEVLHIALRHPQRFVELQRVLGDVDLELFNICADAIVNSTLGHLSWLKLPAGATSLEQILTTALGRKQDVGVALLEWDVERLYRAIDDRRPNDGQRQSNSQSQKGADDERRAGSEGRAQQQSSAGEQSEQSRTDGVRSAQVRRLGANDHRDLVPSADSESAPEAEADEAREWSERIMRGHAGDGAFSMLRALIADLPHSRTPWAQVLRVRLARGLARKPALTWSRPSRSYIANQGRSGTHRMPFEPGFSPCKNEPRLALIIDVSGSIDDQLIQRFAREIEAIMRRQEAGLVLIIGDERVRQVEFFEPGRRFELSEIDFEGGGGTDFTPLLVEADRHRPDIAVVLTDLEGPANFRPRWPVIWAVPEVHGGAAQPFGTLLTLD